MYGGYDPAIPHGQRKFWLPPLTLTLPTSEACKTILVQKWRLAADAANGEVPIVQSLGIALGKIILFAEIQPHIPFFKTLMRAVVDPNYVMQEDREDVMKCVRWVAEEHDHLCRSV